MRQWLLRNLVCATSRAWRQEIPSEHQSGPQPRYVALRPAGARPGGEDHAPGVPVVPGGVENRMKLFHFTAERFANRIRRDGITIGVISQFDEHGQFTGIVKGWRWLTDDPDFSHQSWNERITIPYDRCAVRFTVDIPDSSKHRIHSALEVLTDVYPNSRFLLNWPFSRSWWLYKGRIFPAWLTECVLRPKERAE